MASGLLPFRDHDSELARRAGDGDDAAFATLDARYRSALIRYAATLLRRSEHGRRPRPRLAVEGLIAPVWEMTPSLTTRVHFSEGERLWMVTGDPRSR